MDYIDWLWGSFRFGPEMYPFEPTSAIYGRNWTKHGSIFGPLYPVFSLFALRIESQFHLRDSKYQPLNFLTFYFRREHAEELEDLVDVVNDLKNKDEEVAQLKAFQEVQATELTKVRKDFHKLERDSKDTLEKSEYKSKKDLQTSNTKVLAYFPNSKGLFKDLIVKMPDDLS